MTGAVASQEFAPSRSWSHVFDLLWWPLIVLALVTPCFIGTVGSIGSVIFGILAFPVLIDPEARRMLRGQWGVLIFPAVFVMLAIIFAIHADEWADMRFIFNFTALPLALPAYVLARRHAGGNWPLIIVSLAFCGALLGAIVGAADIFVQGAPRAMGLFNNPNMYAHIALLFGFMSVVGFYLTPSRWRFIFIAGPFLGLAATIMSGSRGTMVVVPLLVLVALAYVLTRPHSKRWVFGFLGLSAMAILVWLAVFASFEGGLGRMTGIISTFLEVIKTGDSNEIGTQARLSVYYGAWEAWLRSPIIGHGWADSIAEATRLIVRPRVRQLALTFPHMHADYLGFAVGAGVFGLAGYVAMLAAPMLNMHPGDKMFAHRAYIAALLFASYLSFGIFDAMFGFDTGISTYVFLTAILAGSFVDPLSTLSGDGDQITT